MPDSELIERAEAWLADDPDPATRAELGAILDAARSADPDRATGASADLADRFSGMLEFGTAGLRGPLGAGPHRMNRAVVIRTCAGLASYLIERLPAGRTPRVVVGFDARHNSDVFAADTCAVLAGAGIEAMVLPRPLPTPVLAFAVRHLGCEAGVMVTASHNPPQDNGYKVYLGGDLTPPEGNGVQIVPPVDAEIAAAISAIPSVASVHRPTDGWNTLGDDLLETYLDAAAAVVAPDGPRDLSVVLTPLHGVGGDVVVRALRRAGFADPYVVAQQADPDPDFPTVAFPNPEEPGAIDLALAEARRRGADLVIANDPDADRCAVAVHDHGAGLDAWRMLRGDELGALLAQHLIRRGLPRTVDGLRADHGLFHRLQPTAGPACRGLRAGPCRDAHRLQVDRPGPRSGVRVRGGDRLLRRAAARPGQGRGHRGAAGGRTGRRTQGPGSHPDRRAGRARPRSTACTPPTSCRSGSRTCR